MIVASWDPSQTLSHSHTVSTACFELSCMLAAFVWTLVSFLIRVRLIRTHASSASLFEYSTAATADHQQLPAIQHMQHHSSTPTIRSRTKSKPPSAEQQQQHQQIQQLTGRWELSAVARGSRDSAAYLQAVKTLQHLLHYLVQHKSTCKHKATRCGARLAPAVSPHKCMAATGALQALLLHCCCCCRVLLQQQLPPELLLALLASSHDEVVGGALHAAHGLTSFAPAVVPVDAAPRLVQLLCHQSHGKEEQEKSGDCSTAACGCVVLNS